MAASLGVRLPTRPRDWRLMGRSVRLVLSMPVYAALTAVYAVLGLTLFVFSRNVGVLRDLILFGEFPLGNRVEVLVAMYPGLGAAYTPGQAVALLVTALLVGVDLALVTYHFREHGVSVREGSGGVGGVLLGTLGGGCAACGSALLAGLLSLFGAGGALTLLPLDGLEFALVAIVALLLSIYWLAEGMRGAEVAGCPVDLDAARV